MNNKEQVEMYIQELNMSYERWYEKWVKRLYASWYTLQFIILLAGFSTSILIALQDSKSWSQNIKITCIIIPALSSLASSAILQFKVLELCKIREQGRLAFQNLVTYGKGALLGCKSEDECLKTYQELQRTATLIEEEQSKAFFSLYGSNFVTSFIPPNKP